MTDDAVIQRARELRRDATRPERLLWQYLRTLRDGGHHFRRQSPFRGYVLDFVCHADRLVIEVDGVEHGTEDRLRHDRLRDTVLAREGYRTLRFFAGEVSSNLAGVCTAIELALAPDPHPGPPHRGEGEEDG